MTQIISDGPLNANVLINQKSVHSLMKNDAYADCTLTINHQDRQANRFFLAIRSGFFFDYFQNTPSNSVDLSETPFQSIVLNAIIDFIYLDFNTTNINYWLTEGLPMDQLYDASIYFQLDDLKELIMNSLLNFDKSKLQDEQTLLNICKSLDFLLMEALFLDQDLKKCLNWFYDEIQVLSDSLLHMILKSSSNNIFESLLTLPFKTKEADRKFLIFFDSFKEKDEKDQNYLKSFLMEGFDAYQDQLKEYFSQCNITNRISSISNSETDEHDQSMFYSNSFTFQSDQEILCQFKFNFDQVLFRTALRQSNHKIGGYVTLDVDKLKELKKIPEFTITVMGQSLKILTSIAIKRNTDFQQWITERVGIHEYGVDELLTSIDLKVGKRYVYAVIFHGLVDFE